MLTDWEIYTLDIDGAIAGGWPHSEARQSPPVRGKEPSAGPVFYMGTLQPNRLARDTFLKLNDWSKVKRSVNGFDGFGAKSIGRLTLRTRKTIQSILMKKH